MIRGLKDCLPASTTLYASFVSVVYLDRMLMSVSPCLTVMFSVLKVSSTIPYLSSGDLILKLLRVVIIFLLYLVDGSRLFGSNFESIRDDNIKVNANPVCLIKLFVFTSVEYNDVISILQSVKIEIQFEFRKIFCNLLLGYE